MKRWMPALTTLAGLAAACMAYGLFGPLIGGMVMLATLCFAAFAKSIVGTTPVPHGRVIDPSAVRNYREEHPGATISEAARAVAERRQ